MKNYSMLDLDNTQKMIQINRFDPIDLSSQISKFINRSIILYLKFENILRDEKNILERNFEIFHSRCLSKYLG